MCSVSTAQVKLFSITVTGCGDVGVGSTASGGVFDGWNRLLMASIALLQMS